MKKIIALAGCAFFFFGCEQTQDPVVLDVPPQQPEIKENSEIFQIEETIAETEKKITEAEKMNNLSPEEVQILRSELLIQRSRTADFDQTQCDALAGNWQANENGDFRCFLPIGDGGKICTSSADCQELCLVSSSSDTTGMCQSEAPLRKCEWVLGKAESAKEICP